MKTLFLTPQPVKFNLYDGDLLLTRSCCISFSINEKNHIYSIAKRLKKVIKEAIGFETVIAPNGKEISKPLFIFIKDINLEKEAYVINSTKHCVQIFYSEANGAFHAVSTIKQILFQRKIYFPHLYIEDKPAFKSRGLLIDIRNKIPTMKTLFHIIDIMADLKLNQLQLYIQGFPFAYSFYPQGWKHLTPLTGEDIITIDEYCKERFIDFVPCQNHFGHMDAWLEKDEFQDLAEYQGGFHYGDMFIDKAMTLDPSDPGSLKLVKNMCNDLLPNFSSKYFNICCDETLELGKGKSREKCELSGIGNVYFDFLLKVINVAKKHGLIPMFWDDMITQYPELIPKIPKGAIPMVWSYLAEDLIGNEKYEEYHCRLFAEAGIPFYVCPGTSSWNSITGQTDQMIQNIQSLVECGLKYGAIGFLNTDWGDHGHWQYLPASYPGIVYGAALSWAPDQNIDMDIAKYLDTFIFMDQNNVMGKLVMDFGRYCDKEPGHPQNFTMLIKNLYNQIDDKSVLEGLSIEDMYEVRSFINGLVPILDETCMQCEDSDLIYSEYKNSVRFLLHAIDYAIYKLSDRSDDSTKKLLKSMIEDIAVLIENHKTLWLARNKPGGLQNSISYLECLKKMYEDKL